MTAGGPRPGAGRPKGSISPDARRRQVNVRLTEAELATAMRLGKGNPAAGLRIALLRAAKTGNHGT